MVKVRRGGSRRKSVGGDARFKNFQVQNASTLHTEVGDNDTFAETLRPNQLQLMQLKEEINKKVVE